MSYCVELDLAQNQRELQASVVCCGCSAVHSDEECDRSWHLCFRCGEEKRWRCGQCLTASSNLCCHGQDGYFLEENPKRFSSRQAENRFKASLHLPSLSQTLVAAFEAYPHRPFLATTRLDYAGELSDFLTYRAAFRMMQRFASLIASPSLCRSSTSSSSSSSSSSPMPCEFCRAGGRFDFDRRTMRVGLVGAETVQWVLADLACLAGGIVDVILVAVDLQINDFDVTVLVSHVDESSNVYRILPFCPRVQRVVFFGGTPAACRAGSPEGLHAAERVCTRIFVPSEVDEGEEEGGLLLQGGHTIEAPADTEATIVLSSGTTGVPKGILVSHKWICDFISTPWYYHPLVSVSFMPLIHQTGRMFLLSTLFNGGRVALHCQRADVIFDTLALYQPDIVVGAPLLFNTLMSEYTEDLLAWQQTSDEPPAVALQRKYAGSLGGRVKSVCTGGAASSSQLIAWMKAMFPAVADGFGTSEVGGIAINGELRPGVEVRIVVADGHEHEHEAGGGGGEGTVGEILARTPLRPIGYIVQGNRVANTDADGFFATGDIGRLYERDGRQCLEVLDRKKDFFKLSNGKFVPASPLAAIFSNVDGVALCCVWGNSLMDRVAAIVFPRRAEASDAALQAKIRAKGLELQLVEWQIPQVLFLVTEPTEEFLTPSKKLKRSLVLQRFGAAAEQAFLQSKTAAPTSASSSSSRMRDPIDAFLCTALARILDSPDVSSAFATSLTLLLGSFGVSRLVGSIKRKKEYAACGVSVAQIIKLDWSLRDIAQQLRTEKAPLSHRSWPDVLNQEWEIFNTRVARAQALNLDR